MDYESIRRKTNAVKAGDVFIGSGYPISVQSMLNTDTSDIKACIEQARKLEDAGCDIIRLTVPTADHAKTIYEMKCAGIKAPLVADIHFDYRAALAAVSAGADKIRINPGNIGADENVRAVANACRNRGVPIRIGINGGSLEKSILAKYGSPTAEALAESALYHASLLEKFDFYDTVISIKSSNVKTMIDSCRLVAKRCDYPLHLGVTEAGTEHMGIIKNAIGIGSLLVDGIGSTVRVTLTADPVREIYAAKDILKAAGVRKFGVNIVSCPTCGRTRINLIKLAKEVENALAGCNKDITVAVMGCAVNGPGEAREADIGVAGGDRCGLIFKKGEILRKVPEEDILTALLEEIERI